MGRFVPWPCLGAWLCLRYAAGRVGRRLSGPSRRARHVAHAGGRSKGTSHDRHHAIRPYAAAGRSRGGADLRRWSAAEEQQPDPADSRRRNASRRPSSRSASRPTPIRKACARSAMPATPSPPTPRTIPPTCSGCRSTAPSRRSTTASRRSRRRWPTAPRRRRSSASPACPQRRRSRNIWPRRASSSGAPIFRPTTGATSRRSASMISRSSGWRPREKASCCCTTFSRARSSALPRILHELKARGYRIVHVVPATPERPATPTEPQQWLLHPPSETVAISRWPKIPNFVFAATDALPAPACPISIWRDADLAYRARLHARRAAAAGSAMAASIAVRAGQRRDRPADPGRERVRDPGDGAASTMLAAAPRAIKPLRLRMRRKQPPSPSDGRNRAASRHGDAFQTCRITRPRTNRPRRAPNMPRQAKKNGRSVRRCRA